MHLAGGSLQAGVRRAERALLGDHEGVDGAVEHVVTEQAQHEGAADALVGRGQVAHAVPQRHERARDATALDRGGKRVGARRERGQRGEAREERVGALVAQQEGEQLLLARDDVRGQGLSDDLAKDVVRDDSGHARSFLGNVTRLARTRGSKVTPEGR